MLVRASRRSYLESPLTRAQIFISYRHRDKEKLEQLERFLKPLERDGLIE